MGTATIKFIDSTITWDYGYDNLGRLIEVKKNGVAAESYLYDGNGNRLTDTSRTYSYSNEDHILTVGSDSYQFNVDGFLTSKTTTAGTTTYNYSSRGELLSVTKPDSAVVAYDHDPLGRRIAKKINGITTEKEQRKGGQVLQCNIMAVKKGKGVTRK